MSKIELYSPQRGELYLMRGLPGSGKSTLARKIGGLILSTDDYFMVDNEYQFNPEKIGEAHFWNQKRARKAIENHTKRVVIDNTNTRAWEMKPYVLAGIENQYKVLLVEPETSHRFDVDQLAMLNKHKVPREIIEKMKQVYEKDITLQDILNSRNPFE